MEEQNPLELIDLNKELTEEELEELEKLKLSVNADLAEQEAVDERIDSIAMPRPPTGYAEYQPQEASTGEAFLSGAVESLGGDPEWVTDKAMSGWDTVAKLGGNMASSVALYLLARGGLSRVFPKLAQTRWGKVAQEGSADVIAESPYFMGKWARGEDVSETEVAVTGGLLLGLNVLFGMTPFGAVKEAGEQAVETVKGTAKTYKEGQEVLTSAGEEITPKLFNNVPLEEGAAYKLPEGALSGKSDTTYKRYLKEGIRS